MNYKTFIKNIIKDYNLQDIQKVNGGYAIPYGFNDYCFGETYLDLYLAIIKKVQKH